MNKIKEIIEAFCAQGVPFKTIDEVVLKTSNIRWQDQELAEYQYIDLSSVGRTTHAITETSRITKKNAPSRAQQIVKTEDVIFGTTRPMQKRYALITDKYDEQICSTGFCVLRPDRNQILSNFLFHLLGTKDFYTYVEANERGASYPAIPDSLVKKFKIPVPPLKVQKEIAIILDYFTELVAELEARKKQYQHYRDSLLNLKTSGMQARLMTLAEIGTIVRGSGLQKKDFTETGVGCIHYGQIYTYFGTYTDSVKSFVSPSLAKTLKQVETGDLVIAVTSENVEDVCKCVAYLGRETIVTGGHAMILKHNENPKYLSYYFQTKHFYDQKVQYARGAKVIDISKADMEKIKIIIPSRDEQDRIVSILDKFDTLVNCMDEGLPAEIKGRRQQYEYYRNQLLTFPEARL